MPKITLSCTVAKSDTDSSNVFPSTLTGSGHTASEALVAIRNQANVFAANAAVDAATKQAAADALGQ